MRRGRRWGADPSWWSAAIQSRGDSLWFNISTFDAMQEAPPVSPTQQENRLIWGPDVVGSGCFLVSGLLAYRGGHGPGLRPRAVTTTGGWPPFNLVGCVLFGISAVAAYVVPSSGSVLDLAAANWTCNHSRRGLLLRGRHHASCQIVM